MSPLRKTGIILIIVGFFLPTAVLPFITEFKPVPELCLTSNIFSNMGNMMVTFGRTEGATVLSGRVSAALSIPYRYFFSAGVTGFCAGLILVVLSWGNGNDRKIEKA